MKREDLKSGMLIEFVGKRCALLIDVDGRKLLQYLDGGWDNINSIVDNNLRCVYTQRNVIERIYAPKNYYVNVNWQQRFLNGCEKEMGKVVYDCQQQKIDEIVSTLKQRNIVLKNESGQWLSFEQILRQITLDEKIFNTLKEGI